MVKFSILRNNKETLENHDEQTQEQEFTLFNFVYIRSVLLKKTCTVVTCKNLQSILKEKN